VTVHATTPLFAPLPAAPGTRQQPAIERTAFVLRSEKGTGLSPSARFETQRIERMLVRTLPAVPTPPSRAFLPALPQSVSNLTRNSFNAHTTASLTFVNNVPAATAAFPSPSTRLETPLLAGPPVPFALMSINPAGAGTVSNPATFHPLAVRLPGTKGIQLSTGMLLSARPEQVLTTVKTTYVFTQQPRPATAEPPRSFGGERQEVVHLVQKEIHDAMTSGAVVKNFTRRDYASITDQVESLLRRRLVVEKERMGFPG
jgi:hypothetical protein